MAEAKPPAPATPPAAPSGGRGDAFDVWLRGALRSLSGAVADEPIPEALRRLAEGDAPHSAPASGVAGVVPGPKLEVRHAEAAADRGQSQAGGSLRPTTPTPSSAPRGHPPADASGRDGLARLRAAIPNREGTHMQADADKTAALFAAVLAGDVGRLRALLPPCGDVTEDGGTPAAPGGVTPLMAAAASGHEAVVELLLRCGADPARRDAQGRTAAFYAREAGHPHLAERLDTVVDKEKTIR